jgi:hypothetical protein
LHRYTVAVATVLLAHVFLEAKSYVDDAENAEEEEYAKVTPDGREYRPPRWGSCTSRIQFTRSLKAAPGFNPCKPVK